MSVLGIIDALRSDLNPAFRVVWAALENHANGARFWSITTEGLAAELRMTPAMVARAVKELESRRIIRRMMHKRRATTYYMLRDYSHAKVEPRAHAEVEPETEKVADPETFADLTQPYEGVNPIADDAEVEELTPQMAEATEKLTPQTAHQTPELTPQMTGDLVPTSKESTSKQDPPGRARGRATRSSPRSTIPEGWAPDAKGIAYAHNRGMSDEDIPREGSKFRNYHEARGSLMASWQAAWRTWCDKFQTYRAGGGRSAAPSAGGNSSSTGARSSYWAQRVAERERQRNGAMIDGELVA